MMMITPTVAKLAAVQAYRLELKHGLRSIASSRNRTRRAGNRRICMNRLFKNFSAPSSRPLHDVLLLRGRMMGGGKTSTKEEVLPLPMGFGGKPWLVEASSVLHGPIARVKRGVEHAIRRAREPSDVDRLDGMIKHDGRRYWER